MFLLWDTEQTSLVATGALDSYETNQGLHQLS